MGKNQKKKGKGAEKTAAKTDKKLTQKMKKQLKVTGEDDIEAILAEIEREEKKKLEVVQKVIGAPSRRAFASLSAHPMKEELLLFGGEFHNGRQTFVYNELFTYKIQTNEWVSIRIPGGPPPRTAHQAVAVPSNRGELWIFGGEFTTRSESQFYHYKDIWVLDLGKLSWEKVIAPDGPTSRSGHRMVLLKKNLIVFGGYRDNLQECKYYNDVYAFSLEERKWTKLEPTGTPPCPRSGCQMTATAEGKIVIWGGYSKSKVKKDVETGTTHSDMFLLSPEKGDTTGLKWKWSIVKPGGNKYGGRSGVSSTFSVALGKAFTFGGSSDHETEEDMTAEFYNELHYLDLQKLMWTQVSLVDKKDKSAKRRRKFKGTEEPSDEEMELETKPSEEVVVDDGVFTMKIGPSASQLTVEKEGTESFTGQPSHPHPRINAAMAVKGSKLFLYGGIYEEGEREHTLSDFYCIDTHKFDEWKTLLECDLESQEWIASSSESEDEEDSSSENDSQGSVNEEMES